MTYATQSEIDLAEDLGFDHDCNQQRGHRFVKGRRHVWAASRRTDEGRVPCWQTADLTDGCFQNHQKFHNLSEALHRPLTA